MEYPIVISPLSELDGGGFLAFAPDLKGCMSDGDTQEEALSNVKDAIKEWLDLAARRNLQIPQPGSAAARAREEHEAFVRAIKEMASHVNGVEARIDEIESKINEISEKTEHENAWKRFTAIITPENSVGSNDVIANC